MRKFDTGYKNVTVSFVSLHLKMEVTEWLTTHNVSNYRLTSNSIYDRLGPFIEFGPRSCRLVNGECYR